MKNLVQSSYLLLLMTPVLVTATPYVFFPVSNQLVPVAEVDEEYSYQIASDTMESTESGSSITYKAYNLPSWLSFDSSSDTFSGTPSSSDFSSSSSSAYEYIDIVLEGTDSTGSTNSTFKIALTSESQVSINPDFNLLDTLEKSGETNGAESLVLTPNTEFSLEFNTSDFETSSSSSDTSISYYARLTDGHSPLPNWLFFDALTLKFYGTAPSVNSEIAPSIYFPISLIASDLSGYTSKEIDFKLYIGAHQLTSSIDGPITITPSKSSDYSFTHELQMDKIYLDGSAVNSSDIKSVELSSDAPSFVSITDNGNDSYNITGTIPSSYTTSTTDFNVQVYDSYGDVVYVNFILDNTRVTTSSSTMSSSSSSSATSTSSTTSRNTTTSHSFSTTTLNPSSSVTPVSSTSTTQSSSTKSAAATSSSSAAASSTSVATPLEYHKKNKHVTAIVCGVVIPVVAILILVLLFVLYRKRQKGEKGKNDEEVAGKQGANPFSPTGGAAGAAGAVGAVAAVKSHSSSEYHSSASSNVSNAYNEKHERTLNDMNAEALNSIPAAAAAESALDNTVRQFLDHNDSSSATSDVVDSDQDHQVGYLPRASSLASSDMYSPIRHSYASSDSGTNDRLKGATTAYYNAQPSNKESWRYVSDGARSKRNSGSYNNSPSKDNRSSYHTLNSIGTNEFINTDVKLESNIKDKDPSKSTLLNVRDSVFQPKLETPEPSQILKTSTHVSESNTGNSPSTNSFATATSGTITQNSKFFDAQEDVSDLERPQPPVKRKSNLVDLNDMSNEIIIGDANEFQGEDIETIK